MKRILYTITIYTILLGTIAFTLNIVFKGNVVTYLQRIQVGGTTFYKYNFWNYINNLQKQFTAVPELALTLPTRNWMSLTATNFGQALGNNLQVMLNYIIFFINLFLYPFRILFYFIQIILALIGLPTVPGTYGNNPLKWLIDLAKNITTVQIKYL